MLRQIKEAVENFLANRKLTDLEIGTVTGSGIKLSEKLTVPFALVAGNLKEYVSAGDTVRLIRNDGGQLYYIVEIIGFAPAMKNRTLQIDPITVSEGMTISSIRIKGVVK